MKSSMRSIKEANIGKRLLAIIMDAVLLFFLWGCLVAWVTVPISNSSFHYNEIIAEGSHYEAFSKIYVLVASDGEKAREVVEPSEFTKIDPEYDTALIPLSDYDSDDLDFYRVRIKYYYLNYKCNRNIEYDPDLTDETIKSRYYSPIYNEDIKNEDGKLVKPADYYTEEWFDKNFGSLTTKKELKNAAYDAVSDFYNSSYMNDINNSLKKIQIFIAIPPYVLLYFLLYFLPPMLYKNGETLGKKVAHLGFITYNGYDVKKRQIVFRQLLLFVYVSFFMFVIGIGATSFATLGLGIFIYLVAMVISKHKRSIMDYAAYTYLIDTGKSVWFHDQNEEQEKQVDFEEKMNKYRKVKIENKNLIQVGTTIVNEDIKKELEEENLKKSKK